MPNEEDPKIVARNERRTPEVEKMLRQFVGDGPKGNTDAYRVWWCRTFGAKSQEHGDGSHGAEKCRDDLCWCRGP